MLRDRHMTVWRSSSRNAKAIFDRYNIIHEQELLDAGDQLVAYLAQQAQAPRGRAHPASRHTAREPPPPRPTPATPPHKAAHTATGGASDDSWGRGAISPVSRRRCFNNAPKRVA